MLDLFPKEILSIKKGGSRGVGNLHSLAFDHARPSSKLSMPLRLGGRLSPLPVSPARTNRLRAFVLSLFCAFDRVALYV